MKKSSSATLLESMFPAWSKSVAQTAAEHETNLSTGLTQAQVSDKLVKYGPNELELEEKKSLLELIREQFEDILVRILLLAAVVSFALTFFEEDAEAEGFTAYVEPFVILLILVINALVGIWQESNAENALDALKSMQSETAEVLRDGQWDSTLPARELVPGDVVMLRVGHRVPADLRVAELRTATLRVEQSSLTGESVAVAKDAAAELPSDCEIQAKENMLFCGTAVANGQCIAIVNSTGMFTEIGRIQASIQEASAEDSDTPLKKKLNAFGELLTQVIGIVCLLVWLINYEQFLSWERSGWTVSNVSFDLSRCTYYFKIAVALAVAAIPEGLPAVITTCLALGTRKMAKQNAIVRKLPSVETLGCTGIICSDKTGTLTTNQMAAVKIVTPGDSGGLRVLEVEGNTYSPDDGGVMGRPKVLDPILEDVAKISSLCNESKIEYHAGAYKCVGAPTEAALRVLVEKLGLVDEGMSLSVLKKRQTNPERHAEGCNDYWETRYAKLATLEFDRNRKSMSVVCNSSLGLVATAPSNGHSTRSTRRGTASKLANAKPPPSGNVLFVKGAPESVIDRCTQYKLPNGTIEKFDTISKTKLLQEIELLSGQALRCLALAYKEGRSLGQLEHYTGKEHAGHSLLLDPDNYLAIESDLIFVGVAGLRDPPRLEVRSAINECHRAGIRVMVITGDNRLTAEAICKEIGVFGPDETLKGKSMTGREFMELNREAKVHMLMGCDGGRVFSRAEPTHKQEIVRLLKEEENVVAMTGDGVNDAPALKLADIGIAMGIAGTEVAKEASDMVLADDNFSTIVAAVSEGRSIYNNMKAFIRYMISSNIGEVASIFFTAALGMPEGMVPVQLLWVNLVTDGPPATALGFNPPDLDIMRKPPRKANDGLINKWVLFRYIVIGVYVGLATVGVFAVWFTQSSFLGIDLSGDGHQTVTFEQLRSWDQCAQWKDFTVGPFTAGRDAFYFDKRTPNAYYDGKLLGPCDYFAKGKVKASTLSLSVLVAIEMFNALNALSEDNSLVQMPPWINPYLLYAMALSFGLHFLILYVPVLASVFSIVPLSVNEWLLVIAFSAPVILVDEVLKLVGRTLHL